MKKKPIGSGNYTVCRKCRGTGVFFDVKKSSNSKRPKETQGIVKHKCLPCEGFGWVDAER